MTELEIAGPNADQIRYWNQQAGPRWVAAHQLVDVQITPLGRRAMDQGGISTGARVLDVGCGCGSTTVDLAHRVGPAGAVTGIDISAPMLDQAHAAAHAAGVENVRYELADAQTHALAPNSFDLLFSRFGVMFFSNPEDAFANLRAGLQGGGRLAFVCWQALQKNPWLQVPLMAAAQHLTLPPPPAPDAPGPFSFANADRVRRILERAGFGDIVIEAVNTTLTLGGGVDLDQAAELMLQIGPAASALRDAGAAARPAVASAVREALAPFLTPDGVQMTAAAWLVTARG